MNVLRSALLIVCSVNITMAYAGASKEPEINFPLGNEWGEPAFSQYTSINKTAEWRYTRKNATLLITRTKCATCNPITQQNVDEYNNQKGQATENALLLSYKGTPAMLRLHTSHKNVNLRIFQIYTNGFYYEIQLGINKSATYDFSFKRENEFMEMINGFTPS